jgi:glycosyltransferase involved in cell wall biosynthesis
MAVKHFGIFLAYGPTLDLRTEGLGRLLGAFLKAAAARDDVRFVIACPGWLKPGLLAFFESEGIPADSFELATTGAPPFILRLYLSYLERQHRRRMRPRKLGIGKRILAAAIAHRNLIERWMVSARNLFSLSVVVLYASLLGILLSPLLAIVAFVWLIGPSASRAWKSQLRLLKRVVMLLPNQIRRPGEDPLDVRLFRLMVEAESQRMVTRADGLTHVKAWLSPTAFWPAVNRIARPTVLCVPDVLLSDFPVGFAGDEAHLKALEDVENSIRGSRSFVTYSSQVKWRTLVDRYSIDPCDIDVIPHACWDLRPWIEAKGFSDGERATRATCESLLQTALARVGGDGFVRGMDGGSLRYLFYPSQFRPNKNVLTLLRAYEHLLRQRFTHLKLILTGDPSRDPRILGFVTGHGLVNDVLFLHGLTTRELAACYYLADLAVNPSLNEGGCPFTLSEALSVGTPVVMARIAVTEEVLLDPDLRDMMLFDPYDYLNVSARIEWALNNRDALLRQQLKLYAGLGERTWADVVDEYVRVLDRLGNAA